MIPVEYYTLFYFIGLSLWTCIFCIQLTKYSSPNNIPDEVFTLFTSVFLCYTILFIGLRDPYASSLYLGDTGLYTQFFESIQQKNLSEEKEWGFYFLMKLFYPIGVKAFYFFCALIYVILPYFTFRKFFGRYAFFALCLLISSMSFWGFGINGLRNGLASSIFIYALGFYPKKFFMFLIMWVSTFFHQSMYLPLICFLLASYFKHTKMLLIIWLVSIFISLAVGEKINDIIQNLFQIIGFEDRRTDNIFTDVEDLRVFKTGFRFDFVLYSAVPIALGYFYLFKRDFKSPLYVHFYNTYILANTIWIIMIYAPFTNRTAYLSWFLMPLVIIYPILQNNSIVKNKGKAITFMLLISMLFTLVMQLK